MLKKVILLVFVLSLLVYLVYGITCTVKHNKEVESISPYCASCWALTDLFKGEE